MSISYLAHTRPGVSCNGQAAGLLLYERLRELGYVTRDEVSEVATVLSNAALSDEHMVRVSIDWENRVGHPPPGFAVGVSRYFGKEAEL